MWTSLTAALSVATSFLLCTDLHAAQTTSLGAGIFCNSADAISRYIRQAEVRYAAEMSTSSQPTCAGAAAYYVREEVQSLQDGTKSFRVVRITVVGVFREGVLYATEPNDQFMAVLERGTPV